ncbi:hypothetical protein CHUAL_001526 [Chamberlinius hualienensis]
MAMHGFHYHQVNREGNKRGSLLVMVPVDLHFNVDNWGMSEDLKFFQGRLSNGLGIFDMSLNLLSSNKQVVGRDFNIDLGKHSSSFFKFLVLEYSFKFGISLPNRVTEHSATCIDNVLIDLGGLINRSKLHFTFLQDLSDINREMWLSCHQIYNMEVHKSKLIYLEDILLEAKHSKLL